MHRVKVMQISLNTEIKLIIYTLLSPNDDFSSQKLQKLNP